VAPSPGSRLGSYEIVSLIGAGGMGEVFRARDTKLNRDVALKILPDTFADDAERVARFKREAQVLAALNHPHIAAIYGLEDAPATGSTQKSVVFLELELVDGEDLAQRIERGPIPVDDAVPIARQIADALEAAHEQGIVHRDLKPANIKVRPDGTVKVLDFGLAKALERGSAGSGGPGGMTMSPTITTPAMTQLGVILGTAAYMSPEQAKGRAVDKRSDIWGFGAVLYEMVSGQRAFKGEDVSDTLAAVLRQDVDWAALPEATPAALQRLMARCLERDPRRRLRDIGEARIVLDDPVARVATVESTSAAAPPIASPRPLWRRAIPVLAAAIVSGALAGLATWTLKPSVAPAVTRFAVPLGDGQNFSATGRHMLAISRDGSQIAYVAAPGLLHRRSMSALDSKPIQGLDGVQTAISPAFSPDGRWLAFYAAVDGTLKRIPVTGGTPVTICAADNPFGMSWESDDTILFGQGRKGVMRVAANGGTPEVIVKPADGELLHGPHMLPNGHVLFTSAKTGGLDLWDKANVVAQSLTTGERRTLLPGGSDGRYVQTGHLVYATSGTVFAVPFDARRLEVRGAPVPLIEGVRRASGSPPATGAANFSISQTGSLVYIPGPVAASGGDKLDIIVSDGASVVRRLKVQPGPYTHPRVSPDGQRITLATDDGKQATVWVYELSGASTMRPLTFAGHNRFPIWTADGKRIIFQSDRDGDLGLYATLADGSGAAERLTKADEGTSHIPESSSPAGDVAYSISKDRDFSLWTLSMATKKSSPFGEVHSPTPTGAVFSPDGRWLAYTLSHATRPTTVYVEPFPATGTKHQLFTTAADGPHHQVWAPNGKSLFYNPRPAGFESVTVTTAPTFAFGNPVAVPRPFSTGSPSVRRPFDIMPDGKFVGLFPAGQVDSGTTAQVIQVALGWFAKLNARVPTR
jgi:eukaryotic-like serine/threonine-protein kinase